LRKTKKEEEIFTGTYIQNKMNEIDSSQRQKKGKDRHVYVCFLLVVFEGGR
jgi:hypothetical protein